MDPFSACAWLGRGANVYLLMRLQAGRGGKLIDPVFAQYANEPMSFLQLIVAAVLEPSTAQEVGEGCIQLAI